MTFETGLSPSVEIHVAPGGDDSGGDGSQANPYASVTRAVRGVAPGSAIRIHAGTYPGGNSLQSIRGSAEAPIWIGGAEGEARQRPRPDWL